MPGFGDPRASVLVVGLAPAAHGANRTGRVFTGDGVGGSGDFLMAALHRAGFANIATAQRVDDGLRLTDVYIAAAVRCAPPDNKPTPEEIAACLPHLDAEARLLPRVRVVVALGAIAWHAWLQLEASRGAIARPKPKFGHGETARLTRAPSSGRTAEPSNPRTLEPSNLLLVGCYHPSRQNTNTGKVTPEMYDEVFGGIVRGEIEG